MAPARTGGGLLLERLPVTVVIPAHNRASMVRRALESVAAQVPTPPAEVIVVDDASSDDTAAAAARMGARVVRHEHNRGEGAARNSGIQAASQPWVALLDSDDEWLAHHLHTLWQLRGEHVLVADSTVSRVEQPPAERFSGLVTRRAATLRSPGALLYPQNFIAPSATMVRRSTVLDAGGYRTDLARAADLDLLLRVLERGTGVVSPEVGAVYHEHPGQVSRDRSAMRNAHWDVSTGCGERPWASTALLHRVRACVIWDELRAAARDGRRWEAAREGRRLASHPQRMLGLVGMLAWRLLARRRTTALGHGGDVPLTPRLGPEGLRSPARALETAVEAALFRALDIRPVER